MTLELKAVEKRVGALTHIYPTDLLLPDAEFTILLGTTLSGKTSLLQLMAGLEKPTAGEVWFNGANVTGIRVQRRNVCMVHQQFINYPNFTVFENIASPLRVARMAVTDINQRVQQVADLLQLGPLLQRKPNELSGGQQQRTALARALVKDADLVLLDEPLANLDFKLREELRDELPKLFKDRGSIVVYATTEPSEALLLGGYTATLHQGQVTQFGPTAQIYRKPLDLVSARVFADPPINTAAVDKRQLRVTLNEDVNWSIDNALAALADGGYTMAIHPHHISPVARFAEATVIKGKVLITEISGSESVIHFEVDGQKWISQSPGIYPFAVGETAEFFMNTRQCLYFDQHDRLVTH